MKMLCMNGHAHAHAHLITNNIKAPAMKKIKERKLEAYIPEGVSVHTYIHTYIHTYMKKA
jgi:hypothetical protein